MNRMFKFHNDWILAESIRSIECVQHDGEWEMRVGFLYLDDSASLVYQCGDADEAHKMANECHDCYEAVMANLKIQGSV